MQQWSLGLFRPDRPRVQAQHGKKSFAAPVAQHNAQCHRGQRRANQHHHIQCILHFAFDPEPDSLVGPVPMIMIGATSVLIVIVPERCER
jgi:hypothetical protein